MLRCLSNQIDARRARAAGHSDRTPRSHTSRRAYPTCCPLPLVRFKDAARDGPCSENKKVWNHDS